MNFDFLKTKITEKFSTQENFADQIGVARRTLLNWLSKKSIPNEHLFSILELLDLDEHEEDILMATPKLSLVFRTKREMLPGKSAQELCQNLASSFVKFNTAAYETKNAIPILNNPTFDNVVAVVRGFLSLKDDIPATLNSVLEALRTNGLRVIFFPFHRIGINIQKRDREVAFTAILGDKRIIFLDTNRTRDELLFDLIHELVHIVCGHPSTTTDELEHFCNDVAKEIIYPKTFFFKNPKLLEFLKNCGTLNFIKVKEMITLVIKDFDWSSMGVALALQGHGHLNKSSHSYKRLMTISFKIKGQSQTFDDVYFETFNKTDFESLSIFFQNEIYKNKDIFNGFIELKNAATYGHLSPSRFAEILGLNRGDADELVKSWIKEDSENIQEEGQESDTSK